MCALGVHWVKKKECAFLKVYVPLRLSSKEVVKILLQLRNSDFINFEVFAGSDNDHRPLHSCAFLKVYVSLWLSSQEVVKILLQLRKPDFINFEVFSGSVNDHRPLHSCLFTST